MQLLFPSENLFNFLHFVLLIMKKSECLRKPHLVFYMLLKQTYSQFQFFCVLCSWWESKWFESLSFVVRATCGWAEDHLHGDKKPPDYHTAKSGLVSWSVIKNRLNESDSPQHAKHLVNLSTRANRQGKHMKWKKAAHDWKPPPPPVWNAVLFLSQFSVFCIIFNVAERSHITTKTTDWLKAGTFYCFIHWWWSKEA